MVSLGRLILRFVLVPFAAIVAMCVAELVVLIANWNQFVHILAAQSNSSDDATLSLLVAGSAFFVLLMAAAFMMMLPAIVGVVLAEALALRSWIYHAANGAISAWIGWSMISDLRSDYHLENQPTIILAAGLAAGFAYWLIAGWSSGFWKPVFEPVPPPRAPAT
jgi:hypothetical protein